MKVKNTLFIFGSGECGQLPPEYCADYVQVNPTAVQNLPNDIDQVVCGSMHTIIKTKDDRLFSFGCNDMGVLGRKTHANSTKDPEHSPTLLNFTCKSKIKKISCGDNHTAVLLEDGKVYITGGFRDSCGVIGLPSFHKKGEIIPKSEEFVEVKFSYAYDGNASDGYADEVEKPMQEGEVIISNIISGEDHLVCLEQSGEYIYTMGNSDSCQVCNTFYDVENAHEIRNRYIFPNRYHFKDLGFTSKFRDIYCGGNNTFVQLEASLDVYAIGRNAYGSCGVSMRDNIIKKFAKIEELSSKEIVQLCGGQSFTVCLLKNNDLYIWGNREILGMESEEDAYSPQELTYFKKKKHLIKTISCGTDHCLVLTESGKLFGWGTGGNDFEEDTCIAVIEKNEPSEIGFHNFVTKTFSKGRKESEVSISHIQIVSFAGGSSHCAFITSHEDSDRMSIKRGHDEIYEEEDMFAKKHRRENFPQVEMDAGQKEAVHEEDATNEQGTDFSLMDKPEKLGTGENKKGSFFKDLFYNPQTPVNSKYYIQSKDLENMDSDLLGTVDKTTVSKDTQKRRRSVKTKPYLSNESPTRRQPRRSCKENINLSEKTYRQFYQIVDTPISKKKRKTTPSSMSRNVKMRGSPSERTSKSRSVGGKRESVERSYSKRDNPKHEFASQTPDAKVVRVKSSKMKN
ncbi:Regulator of chromosome condensation [Plasmodium coatneyi]|uniref:Regulator of chromosome condensation n=1 Tax=Plasmodium coatneyi TaxID=208452 RepID=A0A1B1DT82_9APIC|nr:Regulator of chromosome condensation [Plasmodium coatneyi]ANQ05807.1 Regulator of chromosome condensation [Plasmodium coatneyi]